MDLLVSVLPSELEAVFINYTILPSSTGHSEYTADGWLHC